VNRRAYVATVAAVAVGGCVGTDQVEDRVRDEVSERLGDEAEELSGIDVEETTLPDEPPEDAPTADEEWRLYEFEADEHYEYRVHSREDGPGSFHWTVSEVDGDRLTVEASLAFEDGEEFSRTVTGTDEEVFSELMATPAAVFVAAGLHSPYVTTHEGGVYEGYEWSVVTSEGSLRFAVDGTDRYLGIECYRTVTEVDGEVVHESCLSPDLAFPAAVVYRDEETGEVALEMELIEYERN